MKAHYTGRVATFDEHRGRGEVEARGGMRFPFHCTAIADGTRTIAPDTPVRFRLVIGPLGALRGHRHPPAGRAEPWNGGAWARAGSRCRCSRWAR